MTKNSVRIFLVLTVLAFTSLACSLSGLSSLIPGSGSSTPNPVTDLWPDVPKMSGMTVIQQELPVEIKLAVQTFFAAASSNQGAINFIAFSTSQTPTDVVNYYSADKMKSAGWTPTEQSGCLADTTTPGLQGGLCLYGRKTGPNTSTLVAILPSSDTSTKVTDVFFVRIDVTDNSTPTP
jgi:hypothetical protein